MWRSVTRHHPTIGYTLIPGVRARVSLPNEDTAYLVRVNAQGFRCEHDFASAKAEGKSRVLLFGDSFTAGDGVSNRPGYGERPAEVNPWLRLHHLCPPG